MPDSQFAITVSDRASSQSQPPPRPRPQAKPVRHLRLRPIRDPQPPTSSRCIFACQLAITVSAAGQFTIPAPNEFAASGQFGILSPQLVRDLYSDARSPVHDNSSRLGQFTILAPTSLRSQARLVFDLRLRPIRDPQPHVSSPSSRSIFPCQIPSSRSQFETKLVQPPTSSRSQVNSRSSTARLFPQFAIYLRVRDSQFAITVRDQASSQSLAPTSLFACQCAIPSSRSPFEILSRRPVHNLSPQIVRDLRPDQFVISDRPIGDPQPEGNSRYEPPTSPRSQPQTISRSKFAG